MRGADVAALALLEAAIRDIEVAVTLTQQELEAAHCWEADDHVSRQPAMTEFRRRLRYHQAQWREANGYPIGSQPIAPQCPPGTHGAGTAQAVHPALTPRRTNAVAGAEPMP